MNAEKTPDYKNLPLPKGYRSYIKDIGPTACDLYALTMIFSAWKLGFVEEKVTTSHIFCRGLVSNGQTYKDSENDEMRQAKVPYLVNAGLGLVAEWFSGWKWRDDDLRFLAQQNLFPDDFLHWLSEQRLTLDIDAMPEGELIFPQEPSLRLKGLWWQQMAVEATTLSLISTSTNLATVASQVRLAAQREARKAGSVLVEASALELASLADMSLRRSPCPGAIPSARAAYLAGWDSTSNVYAGKCYDIPVMGTFAHAWVMLHDTEEEAFENWAKVNPGATVFLVDTYSTIEGIETAIRVCKKNGLTLKGVRLDSGNLAYLSFQARKMLDKAGYKDARILATDSISVSTAASLFKHVPEDPALRESFVTGFGIGSEVAVNRNQPLLGFVMKLAAIHADRSTGRDELVREVIKLSESSKKTTLPGPLDVIRYVVPSGHFAGDTIVSAEAELGDGRLAHDLYSVHTETGKAKLFPKGAPFVRLLRPFMRGGEATQKPYAEKDAPGLLRAARALCGESLKRLEPDHLLLPPDLPHYYGVGVDERLKQRQNSAVRHINGELERHKQCARFGLT